MSFFNRWFFKLGNNWKNLFMSFNFLFQYSISRPCFKISWKRNTTFLIFINLFYPFINHRNINFCPKFFFPIVKSIQDCRIKFIKKRKVLELTINFIQFRIFLMRHTKQGLTSIIDIILSFIHFISIRKFFESNHSFLRFNTSNHWTFFNIRIIESVNIFNKDSNIIFKFNQKG
jgi:hypothetical protein